MLSFKKRKIISSYLFILPTFVVMGIFVAGPLLYAIGLSLYVGRYGKNMFGLGNFFLLWQDDVFWQTFYNSIFYVCMDVFSRLMLSLSLALVLNSALTRFKTGFRALFFSPVLLSAVVAATMFKVILNYKFGFLNYILNQCGISSVNWLSDSKIVKFSVIAVEEWRWAGYTMIYFLAGLQAIPPELYEAAKIDGANRGQCFWSITLPLLRPIIILVITLSLIGTFKLFDTPWLLTRGGPGYASMPIGIFLYKNAFVFGNYEYGCAIGMTLFLIIAVVGVLQGKIMGVFKQYNV